jgi:hypothetical protein
MEIQDLPEVKVRKDWLARQDLKGKKEIQVRQM